MTSSKRNIFRVTGPLCGEFTGRSRVNSPHKGQWRGALMFSLICLNKRLSKQSRRWWFETPSRPLWLHCNVEAIYRTMHAASLSGSRMTGLAMSIKKQTIHPAVHWFKPGYDEFVMSAYWRGCHRPIACGECEWCKAPGKLTRYNHKSNISKTLVVSSLRQQSCKSPLNISIFSSDL